MSKTTVQFKLFKFGSIALAMALIAYVAYKLTAETFQWNVAAGALFGGGLALCATAVRIYFIVRRLRSETVKRIERRKEQINTVIAKVQSPEAKEFLLGRIRREGEHPAK